MLNLKILIVINIALTLLILIIRFKEYLNNRKIENTIMRKIIGEDDEDDDEED